ncbi:MAG: EAL domain-containing protein [Rhodoferax sp.]|nr:EAL domain-containing protein [Rhodoferax sp.]
MIKESTFGLGIAFACNFDGEVSEVVWDDLSLRDKLLEAAHFVCIFDADSVKKGLAFFLEVKEHGAAFNWEIDITLLDRPASVCFSGILLGDRVVIMATVTDQTDNKIYEGLSSVINKQTNNIRTLNKKRPAESKTNSDSIPDQVKLEMITDMMTLNNRLVNAERELARKHSELRRLSTSVSKDLQLAQRVLHFSGEAVMISDRDLRVVDVNSAFTSITGFSKAESVNHPLVLSERESDTVEFHESIFRSVSERGIWQGECMGRRRDGTLFPKWLSISMIPDESGEVGHYVVNFSDISRLKHAEAQWQRLAYYDDLTNLPNRSLFKDRLQQAITKANRTNESLLVLFIDLDEFKIVNDSLGHDVGDLLLCETARRLETCARKADTVYRLGGDEFTVIVHGCDDDLHAVQLSEKFIETLKVPFLIGDELIHIGASIGIARYLLDGDSVELLTKNADTAMYAAKASGRNRSCFFSEALGEKVANHLNLRAQIAQGLQRREFAVFLQPEIDLLTGKVIAMEALVRWNHPSRGLVGPNDFISVAEDSGLIVELGEFVLDEALRMVRGLRDLGWDNLRVAVNVSGRQLAAPDFSKMVVNRLVAHQLPGHALIIEITESMVLGNLEYAVQVLETLKESGIEAAIDDFGTGYSSLNHLRRLPVEFLKIDKSFVADIDIEKDSKVIVRAILAMAKSLGIRTVAEGIERHAHRSVLSEMGCDIGQGYLYAKPVPYEEFLSFMETKSAAVNALT